MYVTPVAPLPISRPNLVAERLTLVASIIDGAALSNSKVIGVSCPAVRTVEPAATKRQEILVCNDLASRKKIMIELVDSFLVLPEGFVTLNAATEVLTTRNLGAIDNPIAFLNL